MDPLLASAMTGQLPCPTSPSLPLLDLPAFLVQMEAGGLATKGELSDSEDFWSDPARIATALPSIFGSLRHIVAKHMLQDLFTFVQPDDGALQLAGELCTEMDDVLKTLRNEKSTAPIKRRRLKAVREALSSCGVLPRALTTDSFDVSSFFSSQLAPGSLESLGTDGKNIARSGAALATGMSCKSLVESVAPTGVEGDVSEGLEQQLTSRADVMWNQSESLVSDSLHLAMRLHAVKERPQDLSSADVKQWQGLAASCLQTIASHRDRCIAFSSALGEFSALCGAMKGSTVRVDRSELASIFKLLDRLLEGSIQAKVVVEKVAVAEAKHLDDPISAIGNIIRFVRMSHEYRANFSGDVETWNSVRVSRSFLQRLLDDSGSALSLLAAATREISGVPTAVLDGVRAISQKLAEPLGVLKERSQDVECTQTPLRALRSLLLLVQQSRSALRLDASVSVSASISVVEASTSKQPPHSEDAEQAEKDVAEDLPPLPRLGVGRESGLQPLLKLLPLDTLSQWVREHAAEMAPASPETPLAPFVQQALRLGHAIMQSGLESALGMAMVSGSLLQLVCFLLEHGMGQKTEESGKAEDDSGGQKTEWESGTGMGDGDGTKDVTDEIEDDKQLEGLKGEEQPKDAEMPKEGEEDKAREMDQDFDAEAQAMPEKEEKPGDEPDNVDIDRQAGEVDLDAGGKLDEKLWNGDKDDEDKQDPADEKDDGKQEDIEAHGPEGEGESDTVAQEGDKDEKGGEQEQAQQQDQSKDPADADQKEKESTEEDKGERQEGEGKDDQQEGHFDVDMQPVSPKEGEGGEGGSEADAQSDFVDLDGALDGDDAGDDDSGGGDGDMNLDGEDDDGGENEGEGDAEPAEGDEKDGSPDEGKDQCVEGDGAEEGGNFCWNTWRQQ